MGMSFIWGLQDGYQVGIDKTDMGRVWSR